MSNIQESCEGSSPGEACSWIGAKNKRLRRHNFQENDNRLVSVAENSSGFSIAPAELLLKILSYLPRPVDPLSTGRWLVYFNDADAEDYFAWRKLLLSLSQTCRRLREFFWPQLWKRIDICEGMYDEDHEKLSKTLGFRDDAIKERLFNVELVRQLEVVTVRDPYLAAYVSIINIEVVEFSIKSVLVELARCLSLLPNLRAVKLRLLRTTKTRSNLTSLVRSVFSKYKYPQIRSVGICDLSYPFLSSCPEALSVKWRFTNTRFDEHINSQGPLPIWPSVESLELALPLPRDLEDIAIAFPRIREFTLKWNESGWHDLPGLDFMLVLLQLRKIEIIIVQSLDEGAKQKFVNMVVEHLLELQTQDGEEKELVMHWPVNYFVAKPTLTERKILPAPRR